MKLKSFFLFSFCASGAGGWTLKHADEGAAFMRAHPELQAQWNKYWASRRNVIIANFHSQVNNNLNVRILYLKKKRVQALRTQKKKEQLLLAIFMRAHTFPAAY